MITSGNVGCPQKTPDAALQEGNNTVSRLKNHARKNAPFSPYIAQSVKAYLPREHLLLFSEY
jgi:hypothetical protein